MTLLELTRDQILAFRRHVGALDERLPPGPESLRTAAWAGLQDSMPRAALLSIHARVGGTTSTTWEDSSLVQIWGPRYNAFVVAARDLAVFTLGRMPDDEAAQRRAIDTAERLRLHLEGRRMQYGEAGYAMGVNPNSLRYGTVTGTIVMRWEGARAPVVWIVPAPDMEPSAARLELARRYLHVYGPTTADAFARWAGVGRREAVGAFRALDNELTPVRTPLGEATVLSSDEEVLRAGHAPSAAVRLLPSGDSYWLLHGRERELLVPDGARRPELWTPRVWPGAILVDGEIRGIWQRDDHRVLLRVWDSLRSAQREAVEREASALPVPSAKPVSVRWET